MGSEKFLNPGAPDQADETARPGTDNLTTEGKGTGELTRHECNQQVRVRNHPNGLNSSGFRGLSRCTRVSVSWSTFREGSGLGSFLELRPTV